MRLLLPLTLLLATAAPVSAQDGRVVPRKGLVITRSAVFAPGEYRIRADTSLDAAVIVVRGSDIVLDLTGVELVGAQPGTDPDAGAGLAILVDGGRNVTVKGARIRGFKVAIRARGTRNLRLLDNDLSFNWKPRLYSRVEHESLVDWLSYHRNEEDEWLRYGAAIYLRDVQGGEIRGNTVRQGMNGLLMTGTDSLLVWNNDFSFNSGLGAGLYRSDHNRFMHNRMDYNVRGYSEGFYRRGQDSAGLLIYEQSDSNVVAHNSITHGGDGLFLWAGQHTMDTGLGGSNDNLFFNNDFSWAPTNGMEATFSRNWFIENRIVGSDHGLWGGYSWESLIYGNRFERNRIGIAIEHGQENRIIENALRGDSTAIYLWANRIEPGDWQYPKLRDTRSHRYLIDNNLIHARRVAFRIGDTHNSVFRRNHVVADSFMVVRGDTSGLAFPPTEPGARTAIDIAPSLRPEPLLGGDVVLPSAYADWPRSTIIVDEWGPYDWTQPKLWPADSSVATPLRLRVLGPGAVLDPRSQGLDATAVRSSALGWRQVEARGATLDKQVGRFGDTITVTPDPGRVEDWTIVLAESREPSTPFSYSRFDPRATWHVRVFAWDSTTHPLNAPAAFGALLRGERGVPVFTTETGRLDYMWYRPPARVRGWPQERAGVVATTTVDLPPGRYALRTISDDGIRVYVDGRLVLMDWSVHGSKVAETPLADGRHEIRVEYFQGDGWAELRTEIVKR